MILPLRSWPPFTRPLGAITIVSSPFTRAILLKFLDLISLTLYSLSFLRRKRQPFNILGLVRYRMPTQLATYRQRLRASKHTCADSERLLPLGGTRDPTRPRRACRLSATCYQEMEPEAPRDWRGVPARSSPERLPPRSGRRGR